MTRILVVHPQPDLYGADRMLRRSLVAMSQDHEVHVVVPEHGPMLDLLRADGMSVDVRPFPVLRRGDLSLVGLLRMIGMAPVVLLRLVLLLRRARVEALYVNTLTLPHWLLAGRVGRIPVVCHVREAEDDMPRLMAWLLTSPLLLASRVVANSRHTQTWLLRCHPRLARRTRVIYNGVESVIVDRCAQFDEPVQLVVVGRLSPRKGQDTAIEALAVLREWGVDAHLELVGAPFRGYEWFESDLRRLVDARGLSDRVAFRGEVVDTSAAYENADIVLIPSRKEPFGNVAIEAMTSARLAIACNVGGLNEIIVNGHNGILICPGDPTAMATAVRDAIRQPDAAMRLADCGRRDARRMFNADRYAVELVAELEEVVS